MGLFRQVKGKIDREDPKRFLGGLNKEWLGTDEKGATRSLGDKRTMLAKKLGDYMTRQVNYYVPLLEETTIYFGGPLAITDINESFGAIIDPLRKGFEGSTDVESTMADPSEFQVPYLVAGLQWLLEPDPEIFVALCTSDTIPTGDPQRTKGASPDDVSASTDGDIVSAGLRMAILNWAKWQERMFYYMARAFFAEWQVGNRETMMNMRLSDIAYTPSNAQNGSSSSSEDDLEDKVDQVNAYYQSQFANMTRVLQTIDFTRIGHNTASANESLFRPTRAYKTVPTTYGGMGLRGLLRGNKDIYKLAAPVCVPAGVKIGLHANQASADERARMVREMDVAYGKGGPAPANFADDPKFNSQAATTGLPEPDQFTATQQDVAPFAGQDHWKGGAWKMKVGFYGAELRPDEVQLLRDVDYRKAIEAEFNYKFPLWT